MPFAPVLTAVGWNNHIIFIVEKIICMCQEGNFAIKSSPIPGQIWYGGFSPTSGAGICSITCNYSFCMISSGRETPCSLSNTIGVPIFPIGFPIPESLHSMIGSVILIRKLFILAILICSIDKGDEKNGKIQL